MPKNTRDRYSIISNDPSRCVDLDSCTDITAAQWAGLSVNRSALGWLIRFHLIKDIRETAASYLHTLNVREGKKRAKVLRACQYCGAGYGYRDMREHKRECKKGRA